MNERWKVIPGTNGYYEASTLGRIRRAKPGQGTWVGRVLRSSDNGHGYLVCVICVKPIKRTVAVHLLVAGTFLGTCPSGHEVNHKDGVKKNCCPSNLEYVTHAKNIHHAVLLGLRKRGENHSQSKLTNKQVREIRKNVGSISKTALAMRYGVSRRLVFAIVHGGTRQQVV